MPKTRKQSLKNKTIKNKHKLNKQKNKNKQNKTKKQVISFAQKQKAIKQLKHAIKKHILNIINAHKIQHKIQHKIHGGGCKQCGGSKNSTKRQNGNVNNQGNIFTRLWESFRKVIQRILESMGFSKQESKENARKISKKINKETTRLNNNQNSLAENFHTAEGSIDDKFADECIEYAESQISRMSRDEK